MGSNKSVESVKSGRTTKLSSFIKWAGGKEQELKHIVPLIPPFHRYFEPFVGGGAVYFSIQAVQKFINDRSPELYRLYMAVARQDAAFFATLESLLAGWQQIACLVESNAPALIAYYKSYTRDDISQREMDDMLREFLRCRASMFAAMFERLFARENERFLRELERNLLSKTRRMKALERKKWALPDEDILANLECALKSAFYMHLRHLYNLTRDEFSQPPSATCHSERSEESVSPRTQILRCAQNDMGGLTGFGCDFSSPVPDGVAAAIFYFVRENAYAAMFRYNRRGEFNVPYGGISYNRKDLSRKIAYMRSEALRQHLSQTIIEQMDFEAFLEKYAPQEDDFLFVDPPYDSEFSTYARNAFDMRDQERLARYLLDECQAKFMLVIKRTPAIFRLYDRPGITIRSFEKTYLVSFQARNDRETEHLIVTNY